jgi:hypothetical protein
MRFFDFGRARVSKADDGFTLVVTLVILAAVTILVVGLFGIVGRERQVSVTYDAVDQAELAVQAGLEDAGSMLKQALADELGVIFSTPLFPQEDSVGRRREMLMAANYNVETNLWDYQVLASGIDSPAASERLARPPMGFESRPSRRVTRGERSFLDPEREGGRLPRAANWMAARPKFWLDVNLPGQEAGGPDAGERLVARYCFEVDDVQGRLSLANAGFQQGLMPEDSPLSYVEMPQDVTVFEAPVVPGLLIDAGGLWRRQPASLWTLLEPGWEWIPGATAPEQWSFDAPPSLTNSQAMYRLLSALEMKRLFVTESSWRELLLGPDVLRGWPGMDVKLVRERFKSTDERPPGVPPGSLRHAQSRRLEENTTGAWAPYLELALIPHDVGIEFGGELKMNLNTMLLEAEAHEAVTHVEKARGVVEKIADHIDRHLPMFKKRAGGYTLPRARPIGDREVHEKAYLKALAAGMIDYADVDVLPTMNVDLGGAGLENGADSEAMVEYRGMDAFPLVSETWQRFRYERLVSSSVVEYSITDYLELWNLTNLEIGGDILYGFEFRGRMWVGSEVYPVMDSAQGRRPGAEVVSGRPFEVPGLTGLWMRPEPQKFSTKGDTPAGEVNLVPNEITVLRCPPVVFRLSGSGIETITGVQYLGQPAYGNDDRESRYRLAFRPKGATQYTVVDLPFAPLERYQRAATATTRQYYNTSHCGFSYRLRDRRWAFNVGDPRAAYYIDYHQEDVSYINGSSPWGRNYRRFERMAGEIRTFLWPDGGHNTIPSPNRIGDVNLNPVDGPAPTLPADKPAQTRPAINAGNNAAERLKYIQHLSGKGRFYSVTELGHIFDPIMWNPNGSEWADVEVLYGQHADLAPEVFDENPNAVFLDAHKRFCGGNTLRIGRVEHSAFRTDYRPVEERDMNRRFNRGMAASTLLDLFHCGDPNVIEMEDTQGIFQKIDGHVNVNTASRETLRAMVAGRLRMDPLIVADSEKDVRNQTARLSVENHGRGNSDLEKPWVMIPPSMAPQLEHADLVAEAIIQNRPYVSPAEVAEKAVVTEQMRPMLEAMQELPEESKRLLAPAAVGMPVFGYTERNVSNNASIAEDRRVMPQWNDRAAEESFARLWNNATTRSRHFLITVTGQAVRLSRSGEEQVMATRSRQFQVFLRPVRNDEGLMIDQVVEVTQVQGL